MNRFSDGGKFRRSNPDHHAADSSTRALLSLYDDHLAKRMRFTFRKISTINRHFASAATLLQMVTGPRSDFESRYWRGSDGEPLLPGPQLPARRFSRAGNIAFLTLTNQTSCSLESHWKPQPMVVVSVTPRSRGLHTLPCRESGPGEGKFRVTKHAAIHVDFLQQLQIETEWAMEREVTGRLTAMQPRRWRRHVILPRNQPL